MPFISRHAALQPPLQVIIRITLMNVRNLPFSVPGPELIILWENTFCCYSFCLQVGIVPSWYEQWMIMIKIIIKSLMIMIMIMIMMSTDYLSILSPVCAPVPCSPIPLHYGAGDLAAGSSHCWSHGCLCGLHPPLLRYRHQYIIIKLVYQFLT